MLLEVASVFVYYTQYITGFRVLYIIRTAGLHQTICILYGERVKLEAGILYAIPTWSKVGILYMEQVNRGHSYIIHIESRKRHSYIIRIKCCGKFGILYQRSDCSDSRILYQSVKFGILYGENIGQCHVYIIQNSENFMVELFGILYKHIANA